MKQVLVVDDEGAMRDLLAEILVSGGYQPLLAADGREARMLLEKNPVDVMVTDLAMPGEEGIELIRRASKQHPGLKIVVMSGAFESEVLTAARILGAHATLQKPFSGQDLLHKIEGLYPAVYPPSMR
jgi:CheY-like chemotaxis protein